MKPLILLSVCVLLAGCSMQQRQQVVEPAALAPAARAGVVDAGGAPIERVPFAPGRSSATVERMAKQQGCTGGQGAGLITPVGPVEVYRMMCENGQTYMARCELRQCRQM